ncbi:hypothetical protein DXV76_18360 [Rhodobacteraceae bacterium CCMM004]|nr:hypothetical protein DXV76_18360 [Rhodobacteraceae bacterium CCMM004]
MTPSIRAAASADVRSIADLALAAARRRAAADPALWPVATDAETQVHRALHTALDTPEAPVRQRWLVAHIGSRIVGAGHGLHLPVPPIYAGRWGMPGLIMPDTVVADTAPDGVAEGLAAAAEDALAAGGARILLAAAILPDTWTAALTARGYAPLTLYPAKSGLGGEMPDGVRLAAEDDLPAIAALSGESRAVLHRLDPFWEPHPQAGPRFAAWMTKTLALPDRILLVSEGADGVDGYAVAQPATPLHVPPGHEIGGLGIVDDFHHSGLADPDGRPSKGAARLLAGIEAAFGHLGRRTALAVCPAAWASKADLLRGAGWQGGQVWHIRRPV